MIWNDVKPIGPLRQWACSIKMLDGSVYGLTLFATDPETIELNWPWVTVDGEIMAVSQ